ncbi:exodeoxyribonuclease VII large subunit [Allofournierella sp.]|uniref:exodeoxyribonuclease VII large subunit n=1 Tax=Allofournierella sp. TaxID=1940256 RepID=UPI003AB309F5
MADVITITALNRYVKSLLDSDQVLGGIALRGEVANFVHHYKSGHYYFTLRDERASVKAVMFRQDAQRLAFTPQDGMRVIVRCRVSLYEATGSFQVYVSDLFPDGVGAAQLAFEQLRARLEAEGLFRPEHKRPIPARPGCIGVVTSATGAALQDIRNVLSRRWPLTKLLLAPVNVQGELAAPEISRAIAVLDGSGRADVIIVARGGGSREDLWVFNDERIARAAYACKTPLISAVGHEIDFSILDFVADLRAPTPSAAAELATPDREAELQKICSLFANIHENMQTRLDLCYNNFNTLCARQAAIGPAEICGPRQHRLEALAAAARKSGRAVLAAKSARVERGAALAHSLSPYAVLGRGYALLQDEAGRCLPVARLEPGQQILLLGSGARAACRVERVEHREGQKDEKAEKL